MKFNESYSPFYNPYHRRRSREHHRVGGGEGIVVGLK